jgi:predicted ATPase/tetratricopeptide (TPR) repeat protein
MQTQQLTLLGSPRFAGQALPLSKLTALAAYLVLQNKWVSRGELLTLFYPNSSQNDARNSLRQMLLRLKSMWQTLENDTKTAKVRLLLPCDVHELRAVYQQKALARVLEFETSLLEGLHLPDAPEFMEWLEFERNDLRVAWVQMALGFARSAEAKSAHETLQRILQTDPLCEEAVQLFLERAEPARAKLVFEQFKRATAEMGIEPQPKTTALYNHLSEFAPSITQHNLPFVGTPFVGREQQLRTLYEIIENPISRLITVVGLGGMGKTRLALQAAHGWLEAGFDGVYVVMLAEIQDISGLPNAIASAMNVPIYTDAKTEVLSLLHQKRVLLVLDNFEHLTLESPRGFLHDLLEQCAKIKVLVTSRNPLEIYGEWLFDLQGFEATDSAQLFWQTAQRHNPTLKISDQDSAMQIVQHLGGMPLAIELAAYWTRVLSPKEILFELTHGLQLETQSLAVPMRQRAIHLMLEQSYDRLTASQQIILQGMCVFRGGATLSAARAITGGGLQDLQRLVETGLLQKNSLQRFDLHELLRQYVLTRITTADLSIFQERQGQYFVELMVQAVQGAESGHLHMWATLSPDFSNMELALGFYTRYDLQNHFTHTTDIVLVFLRVRGLFWTALELMQKNLENKDLPKGVRQQNQVMIGCILQRSFQLEASRQCFETCLPDILSTDPTWGYAWLGYSETLLRLGQAQEALPASHKAIAAFEGTTLYFYLIRSKILLAYALLYTTQPEHAKFVALEAIKIADNHQVNYFYGDWYWEVGKIFIALQEPDTLKYVQGAFEFYKGINDVYSIQFIAREAKELYRLHGQMQNHDWVDGFLTQFGSQG